MKPIDLFNDGRFDELCKQIMDPGVLPEDMEELYKQAEWTESLLTQIVISRIDLECSERSMSPLL